jgi:hypothetical protein
MPNKTIHFQDANLTSSVFEPGVSNDLPVHYILPSQLSYSYHRMWPCLKSMNFSFKFKMSESMKMFAVHRYQYTIYIRADNNAIIITCFDFVIKRYEILLMVGFILMKIPTLFIVYSDVQFTLNFKINHLHWVLRDFESPASSHLPVISVQLTASSAGECDATKSTLAIGWVWWTEVVVGSAGRPTPSLCCPCSTCKSFSIFSIMFLWSFMRPEHSILCIIIKFHGSVSKGHTLCYLTTGEFSPTILSITS